MLSWTGRTAKSISLSNTLQPVSSSSQCLARSQRYLPKQLLSPYGQTPCKQFQSALSSWTPTISYLLEHHVAMDSVTGMYCYTHSIVEHPTTHISFSRLSSGLLSTSCCHRQHVSGMYSNHNYIVNHCTNKLTQQIMAAWFESFLEHPVVIGYMNWRIQPCHLIVKQSANTFNKQVVAAGLEMLEIACCCRQHKLA